MNRFIIWLLRWLNRRQGGAGEIVIVPPVTPETPPETKLPPVVVSDTPATPPPEPTTATPDPVDLATVKWCGANYSAAKPDGSTIKSAAIHGEKITAEYTKLPDTWPTRKADNGKVLGGYCCLIYRDGEQWTGGGFDKIGAGGSAVKVLDNMDKRYNGLRPLIKGEDAYYFWVSLDLRWRTNLVKVAWLLAVCLLPLLSGCRTYYVYQFGTGDNTISVDAKVDKDINPQVKASLQ